jgi:predicted nicotinamide N-methyase
VIVTDGDSDALIYLRDNVNANEINDGGKVSAQQLIWGKETSKEFQQNHCGNEEEEPPCKAQSTFDLIIASDIIYAKCIVEPLWESIDTLLSPNGVFVMAYALREVPVSIDDVTEMGDKFGFEAECTQQNDKGNIFVYHFRRRGEQQIDHIIVKS